MLLHITHNTHYQYAPAVDTAQHMACLQPCHHATQTVLDHALHIQPPPDYVRTVADAFGNQRSFFALHSIHSELSVVAQSVVDTRTPDVVYGLQAWEQVRARFLYQAGAGFDAASAFVFASPWAPCDAAFADYARPSFASGTPLLLAVADLMQRMHADFVFDSQSTQVNTPALQALAQRRGVCQDFSHIMVACLRSLGLPARYVSGYLLTHPAPGQAKLIGSDASHAWVSVYVPDLVDAQGQPLGYRWCDFDPTNNRWGWSAPGPDYVIVAHGRDFGDVSPLRGVIHGGANQQLTVGVTVTPLHENPTSGNAAFTPTFSPTSGASYERI